METLFVSMAIISIVAIASPLAASLIPRKPIPEVVFLLFAGAVLGPNLLGFIHVDESISLISELGMAFLFLLAGMEIDPKDLSSERGKAAAGTWAVSFILAFLMVTFIPVFSHHEGAIAIVIAMTSTALGTLLPILKERDLLDKPVGKSVLSHGAMGELLPVLAMAVLLSVRSTIETIVVLVVFLLIALIAAFLPKVFSGFGKKMAEFLASHAETTSQTMVRATVALLVGLVTVAALFELDIVLGAFAAGFVISFLVAEEEDTNFMSKLDGVAYGFFIPFFFVVSGANINLKSVFADPLLLFAFTLALLFTRTIPVYLSTFVPKEDKEEMTQAERISIALYATAALPIIVAVTNLALSSGLMDEVVASILVTAGAITVLIMPILTAIISTIVSSHPVDAAVEMVASPGDALEIFKEHAIFARESTSDDQEVGRLLARRYRFIQNMKTSMARVMSGKTSYRGYTSWPELKAAGEARWEEINKRYAHVLEHETKALRTVEKRWKQLKDRGDRAYKKYFGEDALKELDKQGDKKTSKKPAEPTEISIAQGKRLEINPAAIEYPLVDKEAVREQIKNQLKSRGIETKKDAELAQKRAQEAIDKLKEQDKQ
ncbi:MAG: cation:proton antiporter [Coriobacteriia bacterium]|nr:cation:proton antiporter [Coriobacteriia bacterium]